jgi:hypothetical protein
MVDPTAIHPLLSCGVYHHFMVAIRHLRDNGFSLVSASEPELADDGRFLYFRDPDGVKVQLSAADYQG